MKKLSENDLTEKEFLENYDINKYFRPSVTVDAILYTIGETYSNNYRKLSEKQLEVLLIKRNTHPFKNVWAFPGKFIQEDETFLDAINNCIESKVHVNNIYLEQLYTWGDPNRDPRGSIISASYMGLVSKEASKIVESDTLKWFSVNVNSLSESTKETKTGYKKTEDIEILLTSGDIILKNKVRVVKELKNGDLIIYTQILKSDLAFDHAKLLIYSLERLKNKVEYTTIAFNLLPEKFTLTELQQVYEVLLDKPLLKANFRRKIADMVVETDFYDEFAGHRPSKLYCFNKNYQSHMF